MPKQLLTPLLAFLLAASGAAAQEGHPLVGTWRGSWGPNASERHAVTIVMQFDGKVITGVIAPGPNAIQVRKVDLEPTTWSVHFEATSENRDNSPRIVVDGTIKDVTSRRRSISGTWLQGTVKADFVLSRDD